MGSTCSAGHAKRRDGEDEVQARPLSTVATSRLESLPDVVLDRLFALLAPNPHGKLSFAATRTNGTQVEVADADGTHALFQLANASPKVYARALHWAIHTAPVGFVSLVRPDAASTMVRPAGDPARALRGRLGLICDHTAEAGVRIYLITAVTWNPAAANLRPFDEFMIQQSIVVPCRTVSVPFHQIRTCRLDRKLPLPPGVDARAASWSTPDPHSPRGLSDLPAALLPVLTRLHVSFVPNQVLDAELAHQLESCPSLAILDLEYDHWSRNDTVNKVLSVFLRHLPPQLKALSVNTWFQRINLPELFDAQDGQVDDLSLPSTLVALNLFDRVSGPGAWHSAIFDSFLTALTRNPDIRLRKLVAPNVEWNSPTRCHQFAQFIARHAPGSLNLKLHGQNMDVSDLIKYVVMTNGNAAIRGLDVLGQKLMPDTLILGHLLHLVELRLKSMDLDLHVLTTLVLPGFTHLQLLSLQGVRLNDDAMAVLAPTLATLTELRTLHLSHNEFSTVGLDVFASVALPQLVKLRELLLRNLRNVTSFAAVASAMPRSVRLVVLVGSVVSNNDLQLLTHAPIHQARVIQWGSGIPGRTCTERRIVRDVDAPSSVHVATKEIPAQINIFE
ncbi:hypothetical protein AMAG_14067 [Allomyces macrogynus ATCC 38327]|uniref:Uncharacterized protein n=1 Tax=Allomyces macrogynus (strain ATCC 38327) TaxID=578462 RepID=A0A0L0T467_ALLM3|nr:hypothetical protein AMAG_14067 [Allomyces macrogynus ATCC 38327]|eukprot:KNE69501.1 hypothetical protein AMAG_14067 [Allomyces macrogynus ATCC 38327]